MKLKVDNQEEPDRKGQDISGEDQSAHCDCEVPLKHLGAYLCRQKTGHLEVAPLETGQSSGGLHSSTQTKAMGKRQK